MAQSVWKVLRRMLARPGPLTLEGFIFILLAFGIGLAATNTGTNLLYLIFSLMLAFLVVSGFVSVRTLKKIKVERSLPRHIVAGETVDIRVTVRNNKRLACSYGLQVSDTLRDGTVAGCCYFLRVPPRGEASAVYPCVFHRRGLYPFYRLVVTTTYPFGLVRRSVSIAANQDVLVYPQILPWERLGLESPPDLGERESRRKGAGTSLYGLREQHPSEGARWIHWKKTAQTDRLMRREFEAEEKKNVCLVLDNGLHDPGDPAQIEAFEHAVILTASVAHHLLRSDHQVELVTRSGRIAYNTGPHQRYRILRALALIQPVVLTDEKPLRLVGGADAATIVFRCEGQGDRVRYPRGAQVFVVGPPPPNAASGESIRAEPVHRRQPEAAGV
ncbi:MAG: DUF58 domain-containing protein [Candidatus Sumerlaeia bacterium]|nr:DUF58 domain-containing protein [Candidatus Sumerlaeia bacterium]